MVKIERRKRSAKLGPLIGTRGPKIFHRKKTRFRCLGALASVFVYKTQDKKKQQKMFPSSPLPWPPAVSATPRLNSWQLTRGSPLALRARARRFALYIRIRKVPGVTDGGGGARSWIDLPLAVKIFGSAARDWIKNESDTEGGPQKICCSREWV